MWASGLFLLYMLQSVPAAVLETYLPQVLKALDVSLATFGWVTVVFLPFNVRFLSAACYSRWSLQPRSALAAFMGLISASCFAASAFPISPERKNAQQTQANIVSVYVLFGVVML